MGRPGDVVAGNATQEPPVSEQIIDAIRQRAGEIDANLYGRLEVKWHGGEAKMLEVTITTTHLLGKQSEDAWRGYKPLSEKPQKANKI